VPYHEVQFNPPTVLEMNGNNKKKWSPSEEVIFQSVLTILQTVRWPDCCW